ncbi:MAG: hypothetical protein Q4C30_02860 [Bacteroidia bacterium]|nr:hypothetical protein [Bacteroidia bacterium]
MKTLRYIIFGIAVMMMSLAMQSCEEWDDACGYHFDGERHLVGEWIMTRQHYYFYEHGRLVDEKIYKYPRWNPSNDRNQMKLIIERDYPDYYFTAYHAGGYKWTFDSEYGVYVDRDRDMYRIVTSPTHTSEEYIGHIERLRYDEMELVYEGGDYEVVTLYEKR